MSFLQRICVLAALGIPTLNAQAAIVTADCPACAIKQLEALAKPCVQGYSYITDFPAGKLYKVCYRIDAHGERLFDWQEPEPQALQLFQAYENVYLLNGHHQYVHADVKVDIPPAVDVRPPSNGH